jgi:hypothetical protein
MSNDDAHPLDLTRPSAARMYDWYLGGTHNYPVDRAFGREILDVCPIAPALAQQNRGFLGRAVRHLASNGVRQFLDIGSGVPTVNNVHEVAHSIDPEIRVVYVDNDSEAIITSEQKLEDVPHAISIYGDLLEPSAVLANAELLGRIDFTQPVGLLMVAVLHFINPDSEPLDLVGQYLDALPSGSYFAASHVCVDEASESSRDQVLALDARYGSASNPTTVRTRAQFTEFFDSLELVKPGVSYCLDWAAAGPVDVNDPARACLYAACGRKP